MQQSGNRHLLVINAAETGLHLLLAALPEVKDDENAQPGLSPVPLCSQRWNAPSQGAEILVPSLQSCLDILHLTLRDISHIACVRGPGGFTGLRLALTTASGLVRSTPAVAAGMDYLPLLAEQAGSLSSCLYQEVKQIWVITHARRNLVHMQGFSASGDAPTGPVMVLSLEEAASCISLAGGGAALAGSGLTRNLEFWERARGSLPAGSVFLPPAYDLPGEAVLLQAAARLEYSKNDIEPLYVRGTDAEENLEKISASLGLEPDIARERLKQLTSTTI